MNIETSFIKIYILNKYFIVLFFSLILINQLVHSQNSYELNEAIKIYNQKNYEVAEIKFNNIKDNLFLKKSTNDSINFICNFYLIQIELGLDKISIAENLANENYSIAKNSFFNHIFYLKSLGSIVTVSIRKNDFKRAQKVNDEEIELIKQKYDNQKIDYFTALVNKGVIMNLQKKYDEADSVYNIAFGIAMENKIGNIGMLSAFFNHMGKNKQDKKDFDEAERVYSAAINLIENTDGKSMNYYAMKNELALLFTRNNKLKNSVDLLQNITSEVLASFGENNKFYIKCLNELATTYDRLNNYVLADSIFNSLISLQKKYFRENSKDLSIYLSNISIHYILTGNYEKSLKYAKEGLLTINPNATITHSTYKTSLINIADIYYIMNNIDSSEYYYDKARIVFEKNKEVSETDYAILIAKLAKVLSKKGEINESESLYFKALDLLKISAGEDHPYFSTILYDIGFFYYRLADYKNAETYLKKSLEILKNISSFKSLSYSTILASLANVEIETGNYKNGEKYLLEAFNIQKDINGMEHPQIIPFLSSLGIFYERVGEYEKAESYYKQALELSKNSFMSNLDYITCLNNLGSLYKKMKRYQLAEKLLIESVNLHKVLNNDDLKKSYSILNLADLYSSEDIPLKANALYTEALRIQNDILPSFHLSKAITLFNFAMNCEKMNDRKGAKKYYIQANNIINKNLQVYSLSFSSNRLEQFQSNWNDRYFILSSLLNKDYDVVNFIYNNELQNKFLILNSFRYIQNSIIKSGDSILLNTLDSVQYIKNRLSQIYSEINNRNFETITQLENDLERLEMKLVQNSLEYQNLNKKSNIHWETLQSALKENEAAIEFLNYNYYNNKWTDSVLYGALVLRPGYKEPKFVYLFEQKQLESIIQKQSNNADSSYLNQLYQYGDKGKRLYELIWKPLDSLLNGVNRVYASPSGLLNNFNLSALPLNNSIRVGEQYKLRIVGSTGDIMTKKEQFLTDSTLQKGWIFGGIDYDQTMFTQPKIKSDNKFIYTLSKKQQSRAGNEKWNYLLNTLYEASSIDSLCQKNKLNTRFIYGRTASKTAFKNISGESKPYIIHIATHGYFFPDIKKMPEDSTLLQFNSKQNVLKMADNPLFRSGLIFSGANKTWMNPKYQSDSTDDGILTAYEISNLDLSEAKLVVMSACETGLGDIKGSEGVFGLQRAFKLAGAQNIIMSLWKVPDAQTKELMKSFYQKCFKGLSVSDALRSAQLEMSKKYPPYYWAAFKLLE